MSGTVSLKPLLVAAVVAIAIGAFFGGVASANAATAGILPPANPASDCDAQGGHPKLTVKRLDGCRAKEGVGRLVLPSNWSALGGPQQMLVLIDLERVNRGLAPVVGLSPALDQLAAEGARTHMDPPFPSGGFEWGGGIGSVAVGRRAARTLSRSSRGIRVPASRSPGRRSCATSPPSPALSRSNGIAVVLGVE
jgi:hypothetical protein